MRGVFPFGIGCYGLSHKKIAKKLTGLTQKQRQQRDVPVVGLSPALAIVSPAIVSNSLPDPPPPSPERHRFDRANALGLKRSSQRWHQHQSRLYVLRSQLGFDRTIASNPRPTACDGCRHYYGMTHGTSRETRARLVCGFHPSGPPATPCPDWQDTPVGL